MEREEMRKHVVIIGAGFGGLTTAIRLAERAGDACMVTLVDRHPHHLYTPLVYEVATGWAMPDENADANTRAERELSGGAMMTWDDLRTQLASRGVHVEYEEVSGADWTASEVICSSGRRLPFDHLVVGVGGSVDYYGIEGLADHAHDLYSLRQALSIRRQLHELVARKRRKEIPFIRILVGGAGPSGMEFSAELAMWMRKLVRMGVLGQSDYSIDVVEAASRPLPAFHKQLSAWTVTRLEQLGVRLILDACIKGAHKDHVVLVPRPLKEGENPDMLACDFRRENQKEINTDLLVWAGGVKASPLLAALGLPLDKRGKTLTDVTMRVQGKENVWALGDCVSLVDPKSKMPVPPLAQAAIAEGKVVAENIVRSVRKETLIDYAFPRFDAVVPLGGAYGVAEVGGVRFRGRLVGLIRLVADARYFFTTFSFAQAWKIFWTGARVYGKND